MARLMPRPSGAGRWAPPNGCPGSVQLEDQFPDEESESAMEGTAAHELFERMIRDGVNPADMVDSQMSNGIFVTDEMVEYNNEFASRLRDIAPLDEWVCEQKIRIPRVRDDHKGTPDIYHYDPAYKVLTLPDLKYGYGLVEVVENWQLMDYAIGLVDILPDVRTIQFFIYQPRVPHHQGRFRSWHVSREELESYVPQFQATAAASEVPGAPIRSGPHCTYCKALARCPAAGAAALNAVEVSRFAMLQDYDGETLSNEKTMLDAALRAIKTRSEAIDTLIEQEIKGGRIVPGYMMLRSFSHYRWNKESTVPRIKALGQLLDVTLTKEKPITPTQAKAAGVPDEILKTMRFKCETGVKLIRGDASKEAERIFGK